MGNLNLSGMEQFIRMFCGDNDLTSIDVSSNGRLSKLYCRGAGISSLDISNTYALTVLDCEDNYLNLSDIIDDIVIVSIRDDSYVSYANQKLPYEFVVTTPGLVYDETAQTLTVDTVQFAATGTVPDSVFIEVNTVDATNGTTTVGSDTMVMLYSKAKPNTTKGNPPALRGHLLLRKEAREISPPSAEEGARRNGRVILFLCIYFFAPVYLSPCLGVCRGKW